MKEKEMKIIKIVSTLITLRLEKYKRKQIEKIEKLEKMGVEMDSKDQGTWTFIAKSSFIYGASGFCLGYGLLILTEAFQYGFDAKFLLVSLSFLFFGGLLFKMYKTNRVRSKMGGILEILGAMITGLTIYFPLAATTQCQLLKEQKYCYAFDGIKYYLKVAIDF